MTARELFEYALIELNKLEAPSLLLEDYNYFINKAIQQYINLTYAKQELDQQSVDDIRVLKASTILKPKKYSKDELVGSMLNKGILKATYYADLPSDYMHMLNCIVGYAVNVSNYKCYNKGDEQYFAARRLTSDSFAQIINNAYLRPTYKRPYYYLNNINSNITADKDGQGNILRYYNQWGEDPMGMDLSTTPNQYDADGNLTGYGVDGSILAYNKTDGKGNGPGYTDVSMPNGTNTQWKDTTDSEGNAVKEFIQYNSSNLVDSEAEAGDRLSNASKVRLELRFGSDDSIFTPTLLYIDYIKSPMYVRLTQAQLDSTLDFSQVLEFPDYVCFEIVNVFTRLLMENASDPRLQTNMPLNNTIAAPAQVQQAQQRAASK